MLKLKNNSGQMLMEVIFSLSVVVLILVALIAGAIIATRNARHAKNMVLANQFTQEAMEIVRKTKDDLIWTGSGSFTALYAGGCQGLSGSEQWGPSCASPCETAPTINNIFRRYVCFGVLNPPLNDTIQVTATVSWTDSGCSSGAFCHKAEIVSSVSKWSK